MSYIDSKQRPSIGSMAAVIALHGVAGLALVYGLTVSGLIKSDNHTRAVEFPLPDPPPPSPSPTEAREKPDTKVYLPDPPRPPLSHDPQPPIDATREFPLAWDPVPPSTGSGDALTKPLPIPQPSFAPVRAAPRNDPRNWIGTEDYRGNWLRQEWSGRASFLLAISADGRVTGCSITASTGHPEMDAATCALIGKRAKFQPGRGAEGQPVASSYAGSVVWKIPD